MSKSRNDWGHQKFYVPLTVKIGTPRGSYKEGPHAITFKNTNGAWLRPAEFERITGFPCIDNIRNSELALRRDIANCITVVSNDALEGFKFINIGSGCQWDTTVYIQDPRGYKIRINLERFLEFLNHHVSINQDGTLGGSWRYCVIPETKEICIINTEWPEYAKSIKEEAVQQFSENLKQTITKDSLKIGTVYRIYNNRDPLTKKFRRAVYLGQWKYICDIKGFCEMMLWSRRNTPCYGSLVTSSHEKAKKKRQVLMKDFEKSKYVFMFLDDGIQSNECEYDINTSQFRRKAQSSSDPLRYHLGVPVNIYFDEVFQNDRHDFYLKWHINSERPHLYASASVDSLIIRGEDTNQFIGCSDNWFNEIEGSRGYRLGRTCRYSTINESICNIDYRIRPSVWDFMTSNRFQYSSYTVPELQKWIEYIITKIIVPAMNNLPKMII